MTVKLAIAGCCGRMGQRIASLAEADSVFAVTGPFEMKGHPQIGQNLGSVRIGDDADAAIRSSDVLIEFTLPQATLEHVQLARQAKRPAVIGTTGFSEPQRQTIADAAKEIPIVLSPNMSVGVNVLFELVRAAAASLSGYAVAIEETHHAGKKDAPSGTAKQLQRVIAEAIKTDAPCKSNRIGDVVGEHTVTFTGQFEKLTLTHEAFSRDVFAVGALRAAQFVARVTTPGLYDMTDVLRGAAS